MIVCFYMNSLLLVSRLSNYIVLLYNKLEKWDMRPPYFLSVPCMLEVARVVKTMWSVKTPTTWKNA